MKHEMRLQLLSEQYLQFTGKLVSQIVKLNNVVQLSIKINEIP